MRSDLVAAAVVQVVAEAGHTAGMQPGRHTGVGVAPEVEGVEGEVLRPGVVAAVASFERPAAIVPMQPSSLAAAVLLAVLVVVLEPELGHRAWVPRMRLQLEEVVAHMQPPAVVSWSTAEASLLRCCWHTS